MRLKRLFMRGVALLVVTSIVLSLAVTPAIGENKGLDLSRDNDKNPSSEITSFQGIEYSIEFQRKSLSLTVDGENTNERDIHYAGIVVSVDRYRLFRNNVTFEPGETKSWRINITEGLDALEKSHSVTVSTYGDSTQFNFTKEIDPANPGSVPTPYIEEVRIANGTIDSEPSAVAKVTLVNPSIQTYPTKLMVHTTGTDGSFYPGAVRPGGTTTITVELLDERGAQIAGEARLFAGNLSKGDGAIDQVEFTGRAGEETKTWNRSYEPIKGPWRSDAYEYHNATYEDNTTWAEKLSGGYKLYGVPIVYVIAGVLVGLALVRRWR